jgi:NAD(P)-dependent dehydrogenase (short-subunit alcohol dehydrogenase family)
LVNDVDGVAADAVVREVQALGAAATASYETVATESGGAAIVAQCLDRFGTVEIVVNNAGLRRPGYFPDITPDDLRTVLDSHLSAAFFVTQPAWKVMSATGYGRVVMTSSSAGLFSSHGLSNYASAKAGLYGLTKALAYEGMSLGINVNAVLPFADTLRPGEVRVPDMDPERMKVLTSERLTQIPPERSDPALVAQLVSFLVHPSCDLNGEAFSICHGRFARVFFGVAEGWMAPSAESATAEAISDHLQEIRDLTRFSVPMWIYDEITDVVNRLTH